MDIIESADHNGENYLDIESWDRYKALLAAYKRVWGRIKQIERRYPGLGADREVASSIKVLDDERHKIHLEALSVAAELGMGKHDVLADILANEGNLAEYGLPDVVVYKPGPLDNDRAKPGYTYLVYGITSALDGNFRPDPLPEIPGLYFSILNRRSIGVQEIDRKCYRQDFPNGFFHDTSEILHCIAVPNNRIEKVAGLLRGHPELRFESRYFSEDELEQAKRIFSDELSTFLSQHIRGDQTLAKALLKVFEQDGNEIEIQIARDLINAHLEAWR